MQNDAKRDETSRQLMKNDETWCLMCLMVPHACGQNPSASIAEKHLSQGWEDEGPQGTTPARVAMVFTLMGTSPGISSDAESVRGLPSGNLT